MDDSTSDMDVDQQGGDIISECAEEVLKKVHNNDLGGAAKLAVCGIKNLFDSIPIEDLNAIFKGASGARKYFVDIVMLLSEQIVEEKTRNTPIKVSKCDAEALLESKFGIRKFRPMQFDAICCTLQRKNCLVIMATGYGKSVTFLIPGLINKGVTIIFCPLRSLMYDQVKKLKTKGFRAEALVGGIDQDETQRIYKQMMDRPPNIDFVYMTPEKYMKNYEVGQIVERLVADNYLTRFVYDEAHTISQWAHDFRTDYKKIKVLHEKFPQIPTMLLSATVTERTKKDMLLALSIEDVVTIKTTINRGNVHYLVYGKTNGTDATNKIVTVLKRHAGDSALIYCYSTKNCDTVTKTLRREGIIAGTYYAAMLNEDKEEVQSRWLNNELQVICCTVAFGLGIDKADVRLVFHYTMPQSLEHYHQETGRLGRDGLIATSYVYYNPNDVKKLKFLIDANESSTNMETKTMHKEALYRVGNFFANKVECRRLQLCRHFNDNRGTADCINSMEAKCDVCIMAYDVETHLPLHHGNTTSFHPYQVRPFERMHSIPNYNQQNSTEGRHGGSGGMLIPIANRLPDPLQNVGNFVTAAKKRKISFDSAPSPEAKRKKINEEQNVKIVHMESGAINYFSEKIVCIFCDSFNEPSEMNNMVQVNKHSIQMISHKNQLASLDKMPDPIELIHQNHIILLIMCTFCASLVTCTMYDHFKLHLQRNSANKNINWKNLAHSLYEQLLNPVAGIKGTIVAAKQLIQQRLPLGTYDKLKSTIENDQRLSNYIGRWTWLDAEEDAPEGLYRIYLYVAYDSIIAYAGTTNMLMKDRSRKCATSEQRIAQLLSEGNYFVAVLGFLQPHINDKSTSGYKQIAMVFEEVFIDFLSQFPKHLQLVNIHNNR